MSVVRDSWRGAKIAILRGRMTLLTTIQWAVVDAIAMSAQLLYLESGKVHQVSSIEMSQLQNFKAVASTEHPENVCTGLREISSCSCLTVLPGPAWVLLSKKYILFPGALYRDRPKGGP